MTTMPAVRRTAAALAVLAFSQSAVADEPEPPRTSLVAVNVGNFRTTKGALGCRLYNRSAGFPQRSTGAIERRVAITGATARCDFAGVPPGTYAVAAMHDENDNQKLDKNFLGVPTYGYGA